VERTVLETAREIMRTHDPDPAHAEQVTKLAVQLFDGLRVLHGLGKAERALLRVAGLLHDIGWAKTTAGSGKHHKLSRKMILEADIPGLRGTDRTLCSLVARYHRKAEPDANRHSSFAALGKRERNSVEWLSAILRVADGLDRSHLGRIGTIECCVEKERVVLRLAAAGGCADEIGGAKRKDAMLARKAGRQLVYQLRE
jgi:exopolyphosphatase/guanosine-5'-triphosphate,3'-diphosphate pyrophosphatase